MKTGYWWDLVHRTWLVPELEEQIEDQQKLNLVVKYQDSLIQKAYSQLLSYFKTISIDTVHINSRKRHITDSP